MHTSLASDSSSAGHASPSLRFGWSRRSFWPLSSVSLLARSSITVTARRCLREVGSKTKMELFRLP